MYSLHNLRIKLYYRYADSVVNSKIISLPELLKDKKNLFIYFDYEREFGGHATNVCNEDIIKLLNTLNDKHLKTTWFIVGRIFESYLESIIEILKGGHEIGSHTYDHISPLFSSRKNLDRDLKCFINSAKKYNEVEIKGFHAPRGQWSISNIRLLLKNGIYYELVGSKRNKERNPSVIQTKKQGNFYRFITLGDDWPLFNSNTDEKSAFNYFLKTYNNLHRGELAGLGFHPGVLFSNQHIFDGFKSFINYLSTQEDLYIETANNFVKLLIETKE